MKEKLFLTGMLGIILTFGLVLVGCDKDDDSSGTLTLNNTTSGTNAETITKVEIYLGDFTNTQLDTTKRKVEYTSTIASGANRSWNLDPGAYTVFVTTANGTDSKLYTVTKGQTVNVHYTSNGL
jgi:hypothetical protein